MEIIFDDGKILLLLFSMKRRREGDVRMLCHAVVKNINNFMRGLRLQIEFGLKNFLKHCCVRVLKGWKNEGRTEEKNWILIFLEVFLPALCQHMKLSEIFCTGNFGMKKNSNCKLKFEAVEWLEQI